MNELARTGKRRYTPWLAGASGFLCAGWVAGAVWTASVPPISAERTGTARSGRALEAPIVPVALAIPELHPDPQERVVERRFVGRARTSHPRSPTLPAPRRLALHGPDFRSAIGLELARDFEDDLERLTAQTVRDLEGAP